MGTTRTNQSWKEEAKGTCFNFEIASSISICTMSLKIAKK
jgi:hypothetical protein